MPAPDETPVGPIRVVYADDPYLRGVYSIFVQIEKLAATRPTDWVRVGHANDVRARDVGATRECRGDDASAHGRTGASHAIRAAT